mmetsp:Transcript_23907/g.68672  ORF Transcript_23907/g.68672 Transcript_23907/m.68672 type:complete len:736 (+) Transcript_23907:85-2292(+)
MGDVANILAGEAAKHGGGGGGGVASSSTNPSPPPPPPPPISSRPPARPYGLTRDVLELLTDPNLRKGDVHAAPLPPMVPSLGFAAARYASAVSGRPVEGVDLEAAAAAAVVDGDGDAIMEDDGAATAAAAKKKASGDSKGAVGDAASAKQKAPPPIVPRTVKVGNRTIASNKPARRWVWAPFSSSARTDGAQFSHWVRSGVEYPDYPYARFDVHLDPMSYTDEEYERFMNLEELPPSGLIVTKKANGAIVANAARPKSREPLTHRTWTKAETDKLVEFGRIYELRWAVIHDRWVSHFGPDHRTVEELMHRYYSIGARLTRLRVQQAAAAEAQAAQAALRGIQQQQQAHAAAAQMQQQVGPDGTVLAAAPPPPAHQIKSSDGRTTEELIADRTVAAAIAQADPRYQPTIISGGTGTTNKNTFDLDAERERRRQLDLLWYRSKEEEHEEEELRAELRLVEAQIRKLKKSGGHIQAAQGQASGSRAATPLPSAEVAMDRATLDEAFASAAPVPKSGTPYMQSGRLENPESGGSAGINKALLKRMEVVLKELHVPDEPLPTKRVCDMYDSVRKDTITLIALEKICLKREQEVQGRRARLSKLGGSLAALKAAERAKAKTKARQAASKAKSKKASSSSSGAGGGGKNASATSAAGGEKKKTTSGGSKSKSKKTKAEKAASGDGTAAAAATATAAAGSAAESPKKKPAKKSKKKKAADGDDAAKPKAKKQKKAAGGAGSAS